MPIHHRSRTPRTWRALALAGAVLVASAHAAEAVPRPGPPPRQAVYTGSVGSPTVQPGTDATRIDGANALAASCSSFETHGDNVHYSGSEISGHGWWINRGCPTSTAVVTVRLQAFYSDGVWRTVNTAQSTVTSGGGAGRRATARALCRGAGGPFSFRTIVDVDLVGVNDPSGVGISPVQNLLCTL